MYYCEDCRIKKHWPRSAGFPYAGVEAGVDCEVCKKHGDCHDVPASRLVPDDQKTIEEKLVEKMMDQRYHEKAEGLVITNLDGTIDHLLNARLKEIVVEVNGEVDWYTTHQARLKAQQSIQKSKELDRDRKQF
jgi:hypothetical protein